MGGMRASATREPELPHDSVAEQALMGMLADDALYPGLWEHCAYLQPGHFFDHSYRPVWGVAQALHARGESVNLLTLNHALSEAGLIGPGREIESIADITECANTIPLHATPEWCARVIFDMACRRYDIHRAYALANAAYHGGDDYRHYRDQLRDELASEGTDTSEQQSTPPSGLKLKRVSDIAAERITWLWPGYVPRGELSLLVAGGGVGKTRINFDLAVRVAAGLAMPDGCRNGLKGPSYVLIITSENDPAKIMRPQLEATARYILGNDAQAIQDCLEHIYVVEGVEKEVEGAEGKVRITTALSFPRDLKEFETTCKEVNVKLAIFDPLISYTSAEVKVIDQSDVRRFLDPLAATARACDMSIFATIHFSKRGDGEFINRVSGSRQYTDTARSVLSVLIGGQEEDGSVRRWLASAKLNLGPTPPAWSFFVETVPHPAFEDETVGIVRWDYARDGMDADELERELQAARENGRHGWETAADELRRRLVALYMSTPRPEIITAAQLEAWRDEIGVADKTWTKAKHQVGVKTRASTKGGEWIACLCEIPFLQEYQSAQSAPPSKQMAFGEGGDAAGR